MDKAATAPDVVFAITTLACVNVSLDFLEIDASIKLYLDNQSET